MSFFAAAFCQPADLDIVRGHGDTLCLQLIIMILWRDMQRQAWQAAFGGCGGECGRPLYFQLLTKSRLNIIFSEENGLMIDMSLIAKIMHARG